MSCVIFGAGKIARGFIGHLLYLSGITFTFIEREKTLADLLNTRGRYTVNILGHSEKNCQVTGIHAWSFEEEEQAAEAISQADTVFTAVGGKNLPSLVPILLKGIEKKSKAGGNLNIVTCENWKLPASVLKNGIEERLGEETKAYFQSHVGITEAVIKIGRAHV